MNLSRFMWVLPLFLLAVAISPVRQILAQLDCPAIVQQALATMSDNCDTMNRNTACYGYTLVNASFTEEVGETFFTTPTDRAGIRQLATLTTTGMDVEAGLWGVAVLNVQANVPNTIPGQSARFILMGDAEIEDAVNPSDAFIPVNPLTVTTLDRINVRSAPGLTANVIGVTTPAETLPADAVDATETWLRVVRDGFIGWVSRDVVESGTPLDALPVITSQTRQPMQSFYLRTGIGQPACEQAPPDSILVQGPDNIVIDLTINGAEFQLASTMLVRIIGNGDIMEVLSIAGEVKVEGMTLTPGQKTEMCLDEPDNLGADGEFNDRLVTCPPSEPQTLSQEEQAALCSLAQIRAEPLVYVVPIDCEDGFFDRETTAQTPPDDEPTISDPALDCSELNAISPAGDIDGLGTTFNWNPLPTFIPVTGYRVRVFSGDAVIASNEANPTATSLQIGSLPPNTPLIWRVEAMRRDRIVCYSASLNFTTGSAPPPPPPDDPTPPSTEFSFNWICGALAGDLEFVWNALPEGETLFLTFTDSEVNPYDASSGNAAGSFTFAGVMFPLSSGDVALSPSGDVYTIPLIDCALPLPPFDVSAACSGLYTLNVTWDGAGAGATITIDVDTDTATVFSSAFSGDTGSEEINVGGFLATDVSVSNGTDTVIITPNVRCKPPVEITNIECVEGDVVVSYINALPNAPVTVFFSYFGAFEPILIPKEDTADGAGSGVLNSELPDAQNVQVLIGSTGEATPPINFDPPLVCS